MALNLNRRLRLAASDYFPEPQRKSGIAIHHTVCRGARTTFELWEKAKATNGAPRQVATAYIIDRDGTIYELFDPTAWAWQFGLTWNDPARTSFEKRFIGIELANEGPLTEQDGKLYAFGEISRDTIKARSEAFDHGSNYRGCRWFARYPSIQLSALGQLVNALCTRFTIPRVRPDAPFDYYGEELGSFQGVIGHAMVRGDNSDPAPDPRLWAAVDETAQLTPIPIIPPTRSLKTRLAGLSGKARTALFTANAVCLDAMNVAAGSLVKNLLMELQLRGIFLKLSTPPAGSFWIGYELAQGDQTQVARIAQKLGFANVTDRLLEVRHA